MHVGQRIQQIMIDRKISQNRLAKAAQISQSGLSSIISGSSSPKEVTLSAIANALGCSVAELMGEEEEQQRDIPKTHEAQIISGAVDAMPPEYRERALNMMKAVYSEYFDKADEKNA